MKAVNRFSRLALTALVMIAATATVLAQQPAPTTDQTRPRVSGTTSPAPATVQEKTKEAKPAALPTGDEPILTARQVEEIARLVLRESA